MPTIRSNRYPDKEFRYQDSVPTSATDISEVDTYITVIRIANTTAGALTVTITDKADTPNNFYSSVSVPANGIVNERIADPLFFEGGINIDSSGSGLEASIMGWQLGT